MLHQIWVVLRYSVPIIAFLMMYTYIPGQTAARTELMPRLAGGDVDVSMAPLSNTQKTHRLHNEFKVITRI